MNAPALILALLLLTAAGFHLGRRRSLVVAGDAPRDLHSRPVYHGNFVALWCGLPAFALLLLWLWLEPRALEWWIAARLPDELRALPPEQLEALFADVRTLAAGGTPLRPPSEALAAAADQWQRLSGGVAAARLGCVLALGVASLAWARRQVALRFPARERVEALLQGALALSSVVAVLVTVGIVVSLVFEAQQFFLRVPASEFLFGTHWSPQTAIRADQVGSTGAFGAVPVFAGTLLITAIAMAVSVPVGLFSAVYLAEYASPEVRAWVKPALEVLAGVPTVVYGFFAALSVGPLLRGFGEQVGLDVASESALAAGLVMGVMIIPFVSSLSDDVIAAVPQALREGSLGLGATRSETVRKVVLPAALPGIVGAVLLAISRAIGETMIVVMAAGLTANPDGQSVRGRDHGDGADRDAPDRRPGVRQREDAGRLRPRARALRRDPDPERARAGRGAPLPGGV